MSALETILFLFGAAVVLAAAARRIGVPYPVLLALGGAALAFVPGMPRVAIPPELVLALFVAPILVDAGYDASLRDLRDNWLPLAGLVVVAVGLTTVAVAAVAHALVPALPWAAAIALGAIVAPPDAVSATAVLRPLAPPRRVLGILEGESLLNDASALLIYRLAVGAAVAGTFSVETVAPAFALAVLGSLVAGPALGWLLMQAMRRVRHVPTAIILQFVSSFTVWLLAEHAGLSGVLTTVTFAMTLARLAPARTPARMRIPTNAVWATVVFALNVFAFIFIGLQIRPIVVELAPEARQHHLLVGAAVLATVIAVRIAWHMSFNAAIRWHDARYGFRPPRPMLRPSAGSGLLISWAGMRGMVTLAAALALPAGFPERDLIVLTAFIVVLGTLLVQGLTLKPLVRWLALESGDPVALEEKRAREKVLAAASARLGPDDDPMATNLRKQLLLRLGPTADGDDPTSAVRARYDERLRDALAAARSTLIALRDGGEIGDDAFHAVENDLDWLEVSDPLRAANADASA
jgi:Na+/H+ antiporter